MNLVSRGVAPRLDDDLLAHLQGKRLMPDVSVLLTGMLVGDSDSAELFAHAQRGTILLSRHIEQTAIDVLRRQAPQHLGSFGDGLVRLSRTTTLTRVESGDTGQLPSWASQLDPEDQHVLADAIAARADILFVQDSAFFTGAVPGLTVQPPSNLFWPLHVLDLGNVQATPEAWTFLGWFIPQWGSAVVRGSSERFYMFEIAHHIACFYEAAEGSFKLRWRTQSGARDTLTLRQDVEPRSFNFVAVAVGPEGVFWFVNGATTGRRARLGPAPGTTFHPFMSAESLHQICGAVHFTVVPRTLAEGLIRKHWQARTVRLTDREIELQNMIGPLLRRRPSLANG